MREEAESAFVDSTHLILKLEKRKRGGEEREKEKQEEEKEEGSKV